MRGFDKSPYQSLEFGRVGKGECGSPSSGIVKDSCECMYLMLAVGGGVTESCFLIVTGIAKLIVRQDIPGASRD